MLRIIFTAVTLAANYTFKKQVTRSIHSIKHISESHYSCSEKKTRFYEQKLSKINPVFRVVAQEIIKRSEDMSLNIQSMLRVSSLDLFENCARCPIKSTYSLEKERYEYTTTSRCPDALKAVKICEYIANLIKKSEEPCFSHEECKDLFEIAFTESAQKVS